jgi:hypothetical protein
MTTMTSGSFHDAESLRTEAILQRFNEVFLTHDPAPLQDLVAEDCVIENTGPAPDGSRHEGKAACIALWTEIATMRGAHFEPESISRVVIGARSAGGWSGVPITRAPCAESISCGCAMDGSSRRKVT